MNRFFSALVVCMLSVSAFAHAEESASPEQGMGAASARNENHRLASIRLIENYLVPAYEALAAQTNAQATAWEGACSTPTAEQLAQLQQHYVKTANLWAKVEFIRFGPVSFLLRHERVNHWPERRKACQLWSVCCLPKAKNGKAQQMAMGLLLHGDVPLEKQSRQTSPPLAPKSCKGGKRQRGP
jgi:predicted lipoprotein